MDGLSGDDLNWKPLESANSLCVLAVHVMGNAADNILDMLCKQDVSRNRDEEFRSVGTSPEAVHRRWHELQAQISTCLDGLPTGSLERQYEHPRRGRLTGRETLVVVARHAAKHMGQAELTLDLLLAAKGRPPVARDAFGTPIRK